MLSPQTSSCLALGISCKVQGGGSDQLHRVLLLGKDDECWSHLAEVMDSAQERHGWKGWGRGGKRGS